MKHILLSAILFALLTNPSVAEILVKSFTNRGDLSYTYGTWADQATVEEGGLIISGDATVKGGGGVNFSPALDLTKESALQVTVRVLPGNQATKFHVLLRTRFGKGTKDFLTSRFTFLVPAVEEDAFIVLTPESLTEQDSGHVDLAKIDEMQIQGDYSNESSQLKLQFWEIRAAR